MNKYFVIAPLVLILMASIVACATQQADVKADAPVDAEFTTAVVLPQIEPTVQPTAEPTLPPCPITYEEVFMLAQTMHAESQVVYWNGTNYGVSYIARQAAVGWCSLNRLDNGGFGDTLAEVLSKPYQFAWCEDAPVTDHFLWLAQDIVDRWWAEKQGETDVGRTLPSDYLYFEGDGRENHFRKEYEKTGETWDWSIPDPYEEVQP